MTLRYTIADCTLSELIPLKNVARLDPAYLSTVKHIRNNNAQLPIIVSDNLFLLDGHKTVEALKEISEDDNSGDSVISVFVYPKKVTETEAWSIHYTLNNRGDVLGGTGYSFEGQSPQTSITKEMAQRITPHGSTIMELYKITAPIKQYFQAKLVADHLSELPFYIYDGLGEALASAFEPALGFKPAFKNANE